MHGPEEAFQLKQPESDTPLDWALFYAAGGHHVFPVYEVVRMSDGALQCACGTPGCADAAKHPRTAHGFHDAATEASQIQRWWTQWPNTNIGLRTGDGIIVLDVDVRHGGDESLDLLEFKHGKLPPARSRRTSAKCLRIDAGQR